MLNSTMHSRKNEAMVSVKNTLLASMSSQEEIIEMCDTHIERLKANQMNWFCLYLSIAVILISSVSAVAFIAYGYSDGTWVIVKNTLLFSFSVGCSYGYYFMMTRDNNQRMILMWSEIKDNIQKDINSKRDYIKDLNIFL